MNRAIRLGSLLLLTLLLAGCVSGVGGDDGLTDSDREALASLGYLADELAEKAQRELFGMEDGLGVGAYFWYQIINWIGDVADYAERVGNRLRLLIAN